MKKRGGQGNWIFNYFFLMWNKPNRFPRHGQNGIIFKIHNQELNKLTSARSLVVSDLRWEPKVSGSSPAAS